MRQPAGEAAGEQASDNERHGPQDTQERDERHQPPGPARIAAQEQDLLKCRREQGERQQPASPPAAPVVRHIVTIPIPKSAAMAGDIPVR